MADEPTGNLDRETARTVFEVMLELQKKAGISFVVVTHDRELGGRMGRMLELSGGRFGAM